MIDNYDSYFAESDVDADAKSLFAVSHYSAEKMADDIREHHDNLIHVIERNGAKLPAWKLRRAISDISPRKAKELSYMNPYARLKWQERISASLDADESADLFKITIIDRRWNFDDENWQLDLDRIKSHVRNAFRGESFFVMIEFAYLRNVPGPSGCGHVIAPHIEGLIWREMPRSRKEKISARFAGGVFGTYPIVRKRIYDLSGAIRYIIKPPFEGYRINQRSDGKRWHNPSPLSLQQHYFLYHHLKDFRYPDFAFGSGIGATVLRRARSDKI